MIKSFKKWSRKPQPDSEEIAELKEAIGCSTLFATLCLQRGLHTKEEIRHFMEPNENWFYDPYALYEMDKAVQRIKKAVSEGEKITIYGDYDADGVTSTAILVETLEMIGAEVDFYIPNRFEEGYGPNVKAFEKIIEAGTGLIVTCDNGVAGHEAIDRSNELGVDVIITDHHEMSDTLPDAYAVIHPRHPEGEYPFDDLSGAGVAFKVASALLEEIPWELLDLAAIGTVADLVTLLDENRAIVKLGLTVLQNTQRIGLLELYKKSGLRAEEVDETSIGFVVGPRLNALGRMGDAGPAVELLLSLDQQRASELADLLNQKNNERKQLVSDISAQAFEQISQKEETPHVHVLAQEGWHEGVLGIVASRVVNKTGKPAVVLNVDEQKGVAKGSGRSIEAFHLYEAIDQSRELTTAFGGHHMAAGLSMPVENVSILEAELNQFAKEANGDTPFQEEISVDVVAGLEDISISTLEELNRLAPFGTGNPYPTVLLENVQAKNTRKIGANQTHLKCQFREADYSLEGIGFNMAETADQFGSNPTLSVVGTLEINEWNGNRKSQIKIEDVASDHPQFIDMRGKNTREEIWELKDALYVFFDEKARTHFAPNLPEQAESILVDSADLVFDMDEEVHTLVFVDCPDHIDKLKNVLSQFPKANIYACFYTLEDTYFKGVPNRQTFAAVYKYILTHEGIDVKHRGEALARYLKVEKDALDFMIRVFLEAGFVTIEEGILNKVNNPQKTDLTQTKTYRRRMNRIKTEEMLLYSSFTELTEWMKQWMSVAV